MSQSKQHGHQVYYLTQSAHDELASLIIRKSPAFFTRRRNSSIFDGYQVQTTLVDTQHQGLSHALDLFASYYDLTEFIDSRTPQQVTQCNRDLEPKVFTTVQEAREYTAIYGKPTYTSLWSNTQLIDYPTSDLEDPDTGELIMTHTRKRVYLALSTGAQSFYYRLATLHKMTPPRRNQYVSAALEAIGCHWLTLPDDYEQLLRDNPNHNLARVRPRTKQQRTGPKQVKKFGNFAATPFTPDFSKIQPFTPARAAQLRAEMIANGEIKEEE